MEKAAALWERITSFLNRVVAVSSAAACGSDKLTQEELPAGFVDALNDDLNLSRAMVEIHAALKAGNTALTDTDTTSATAHALQLRAMLDVLGLDPLSPQWETGSAQGSQDTAHHALDVLVTAALQERADARAVKDWARADALRDRLTEAGIVVEDGADGARWRLR